MQVTVLLHTNRRVHEGENISVPLEGVEGEDWAGLVSETCEAPVSTLHIREFCSPETHSTNDACGPGLWGKCQYDDSGVMGCLTHVCNGRGEHPLLAAAAWESATASLTLVMKSVVEAGVEVRVVVPQSAGLRLPVMRSAPRMVQSLVPVVDELWDPVAEEYVAMQVCVVLPVCESGIECLYGSDCHRTQDSVAQ